MFAVEYKFNKFQFWLGLAWCACFFWLVGSDVGEFTSGPKLITWWDAVWVPFLCAVFPFLLGLCSVLVIKR